MFPNQTRSMNCFVVVGESDRLLLIVIAFFSFFILFSTFTLSRFIYWLLNNPSFFYFHSFPLSPYCHNNLLLFPTERYSRFLFVSLCVCVFSIFFILLLLLDHTFVSFICWRAWICMCVCELASQSDIDNVKLFPKLMRLNPMADCCSCCEEYVRLHVERIYIFDLMKWQSNWHILSQSKAIYWWSNTCLISYF